MVLVVKNPLANAGDIRDMSSIPGLGRSPGKGHSNPLQYSCLENSVDRGAWWATVHGVTKSQTRLKRLSMCTRKDPSSLFGYPVFLIPFVENTVFSPLHGLGTFVKN